MRSTAASNGGATEMSRALARLAQSAALATTLGLCALAGPTAAHAQEAQRSLTRALVIGIDRYETLPQLRGAVADAKDIAETAKRLGASDVALLTDEQADRVSILKAAEAMRARTRKGDLILFSLAGHGALEPERVKGSSPDGQGAVFLLSGFAPHGHGTGQRILDEEFMRIIRDFEDKGARVLFVADSCSGGGLARSMDDRSGEVVYRSAPRYAISGDELKPISTAQDAMSTELSFKRSLFLAAVARDQKAPEVRAPETGEWRGALSYALARGVEGAADADGDGEISVSELFAYVRQVSYQLTDQRQEVITRSAPVADPARDTIVSMTRGVSILNPTTSIPATPKPPVAPPVDIVGPKPVAPAIDTAKVDPRPQTLPAPPPPPPPPPVKTHVADPALGPRIRLASLDGQAQRLAGLSPIDAGFDIVAPTQQPDLVWDPRTKDAVVAGDVVARNLDASDLPAVVDRVAAVRGVKSLAARSPLTARLTPQQGAYRRGERVKFSVEGVQGRAFYVFNVAGDGTVQMLYPVGSDPQPYNKPNFDIEFAVREPFGADQLVAISAPAKLDALDQALKRLDGRRNAAQAFISLQRALPAGARVGSVSLVTGP